MDGAYYRLTQAHSESRNRLEVMRKQTYQRECPFTPNLQRSFAKRPHSATATASVFERLSQVRRSRSSLGSSTQNTTPSSSAMSRRLEQSYYDKVHQMRRRPKSHAAEKLRRDADYEARELVQCTFQPHVQRIPRDIIVGSNSTMEDVSPLARKSTDDDNDDNDDALLAALLQNDPNQRGEAWKSPLRTKMDDDYLEPTRNCVNEPHPHDPILLPPSPVDDDDNSMATEYGSI